MDIQGGVDKWQFLNIFNSGLVPQDNSYLNQQKKIVYNGFYISNYSMCLPCLGGTGVPCPPLCVSSGTCLVSFSFTLALGRALV